jgi:hypothetical protein
VYYSLSSNPFTAIAGSATVTIIPATRAAAVINKRIRLILSATSFFPYVEAPHPDHDIKQRNCQATGRLPPFTQSPRRLTFSETRLPVFSILGNSKGQRQKEG